MSRTSELLEKQRQFYFSGKTRNPDFRREQLSRLLAAVRTHENEITEALKLDLNKAPFESYETEIGIVCKEIRNALRHLSGWTKPRSVCPSVLHFPSRGKVYREPYGTVLIMSPWNYPFQLTMVPLVGSIAAGNCTILKPSEYSLHTAQVMEKMIKEIFPEDYAAVIRGGRAANQDLLTEKFDYIFFTGSPRVGRVVMEAAAKNLTPVTLELGGKSPCIVDETAKIDLAAKRIVWGKFINAGQTCIAPDYLLVQKAVQEPLIRAMKKYTEAFYGPHPETGEDYPKIINDRHFERLRGLTGEGKIIFGGRFNEATRQIAPTLIEDVSWESPIMQEEIFGPLLPVLTFNRLDEVLPEIVRRPKPLALYLFTTDRKTKDQVMQTVSFGGGCVNDTIIHIANTNLAFGGVGESGMGHYHGKATFDTFTHEKSVVEKSNCLDINLRYPPFKDHLAALKKLI